MDKNVNQKSHDAAGCKYVLKVLKARLQSQQESWNVQIDQKPQKWTNIILSSYLNVTVLNTYKVSS